ncbi:MAG: ribosomal-processing cysteine protease Prp [Bacilli bacterium]|nr:ribosomal-processing cysteine protease Prp [Bacilli bacterium]
MIEVSYSKRKIEIKGHANYAPKGNDIVCAAVSSLLTTAINSLKGFKKSEIRIKGGEATIDIKHKVDRDDQTRLEMLITGLKLISKKYPKYIKIKEKKLL